MASAFIKFDELEGPATQVEFEGWSPLLAASNSISSGLNSPGSDGMDLQVRKPHFREWVISKAMDMVSNKIAEASFTRAPNGRPTIFENVRMAYLVSSITPSGNPFSVKWLEYHLKKVSITDYAISLSETGGMETFSLAFKEISCRYYDWQVDSDSQALVNKGGTSTYDWRI